MYFYTILFTYFLLNDFNFIIKCQIHTNNFTHQLKKPYHWMNLLNTHKNHSNQDMHNKIIVKRKFSEEEFKKMNNQYAIEQNNERLMRNTANDVRDAPEPVYGGDRPSDCEKKIHIFVQVEKVLMMIGNV
ncbi:Hypothetical protein SRAE_X000175900 [Strongyloides ratti]|uniref:Cathepsin propeptide inhibitor domain-containing protein n=1 Tax=Strongyloides ratti TaxID=34506 RepID=A0A090KR73_STRRB|nr:Hypothetical protein SRAE_X000175900 [Strongyloides ratti]CEF60019.1 Hypothetical protein SRAE_X000175900 [Strongyloides ratti]